MFNLIPISLLIMALGGVIFIVSNHLSEFSAKGGSPEGGEDEKDESSFGIKAKLAGWINQLPLDNIKAQSLSLTQKFLHRMRIILLKTDNHLLKLISKISKKNKEINGEGLNGNDADFWKDFSNDNQKVSQKQISEPESETKIVLAFKSNPETEKFFDIKPVKKVSKLKRQRR
ncbi:MAG: hypothetical protein Q8N43_02610 [Candidatus Azambacteria bacterium]|nr:hypothetical protein [Candidatus Azambacteria bacterium]